MFCPKSISEMMDKTYYKVIFPNYVFKLATNNNTQLLISCETLPKINLNFISL